MSGVSFTVLLTGPRPMPCACTVCTSGLNRYSTNCCDNCGCAFSATTHAATCNATAPSFGLLFFCGLLVFCNVSARPLPYGARITSPDCIWPSISPGVGAQDSTFGATCFVIAAKPGSIFFSPPPDRRASITRVCRTYVLVIGGTPSL